MSEALLATAWLPGVLAVVLWFGCTYNPFVLDKRPPTWMFVAASALTIVTAALILVGIWTNVSFA
ncbi:hypothetical protein [Microbacterium sp. KNMS]